MDFFENVGLNILEVLAKKNMSQSELADKIGVSKQVMSKIVKGQKSINVFEIKKISKILNVSMDRLLEEKEIKEKPTLMFMANIKEENKKDIEFLNSVISELILIEEALDE